MKKNIYIYIYVYIHHSNNSTYTIISANILVKSPIFLGFNRNAQGFQSLLVACDLGESSGSCACRGMEALLVALSSGISGIRPGELGEIYPIEHLEHREE